jgi:hypothetical protein
MNLQSHVLGVAVKTLFAPDGAISTPIIDIRSVVRFVRLAEMSPISSMYEWPSLLSLKISPHFGVTARPPRLNHLSRNGFIYFRCAKPPYGTTYHRPLSVQSPGTSSTTSHALSHAASMSAIGARKITSCPVGPVLHIGHLRNEDFHRRAPEPAHPARPICAVGERKSIKSLILQPHLPVKHVLTVSPLQPFFGHALRSLTGAAWRLSRPLLRRERLPAPGCSSYGRLLRGPRRGGHRKLPTSI